MAQLNVPRNIAVDAQGNVYIADAGNQRVRKVDAAGTITTIAGTGMPGYNGDDIVATAAQLYGPYDVAVNKSGELFIADVDNSRVRKINTAGVITTIAGTGTIGYSDDGEMATAAMLHEPISVDADENGNIYIADAWNARVRKVFSTGIIITVAGNGIGGYSGENGMATAAQLNNPYGVAVGVKGDVFISDNGNNRIRRVSPADIKTTSVHIWPNPASNFHVEISSAMQEDARIIITSVTGHKAIELTIPTNNIFVFSPDIAPGMYIVTASTSSGITHNVITVTATN